eukprot:COSAG02_NODE_143_length_34133_cov_272.981282_28_plen_184_part_00
MSGAAGGSNIRLATRPARSSSLHLTDIRLWYPQEAELCTAGLNAQDRLAVQSSASCGYHSLISVRCSEELLAGRVARPAGMQTRICELSKRGFTTSYYVELSRAAARPARVAAADVAQVHRYEPPRGGVAEVDHDGPLGKGVSEWTVAVRRRGGGSGARRPCAVVRGDLTIQTHIQLFRSGPR